MFFKFAIPALAIAAAAFAAPASAAVPVYAPIGTPNPVVYSFAAEADGDLVAYYMGGLTRGYRSSLRVRINGGPLSGGTVFDTATTALGASFNFGPVSAGDEIVFYLDLIRPGAVASNLISSDINDSLPADQDDGLQQIFSANYGGGDFGIPTGDYTFVAFEDIIGRRDQLQNNDFDYNDHRFAFSNVNIVPEPATWAMLITGFGLVGFAMRRRKGNLASVSA